MRVDILPCPIDVLLLIEPRSRSRDSIKNGAGGIFPECAEVFEGVRKTLALETREKDDAVRKALHLANGRNLAIGGTLEGEIEAFIAFKLNRN